MQSIKTVVVDHHVVSRYGITSLVSNSKDEVHVSAMFADIKSAEQYLSDHSVHVLLIDDQLPQADGIETIIARLREKYIGMSIIVIGNKINSRYIMRLFDHGARGFVYKQDQLEDNLVLAIKTVRNGNVYLSPRVSTLFYNIRQIQQKDDLNGSDFLVLQSIEQGYNPQEIARQLDITTRSVYRIYGRLRHVLNVRTNEQIVDAARKKGLLDELQ
ncbi:MAG: response regulator transcription factor [Chloroflexi bacterium]|nr:response regulator transcription factor [Chloroflexota bacterium]